MKYGGVFETHWGDSAKAKVVLFLLREVLGRRVQVCARFNGSDNAGNTGKENGVEIVVHNLPISVCVPGVDSFIAPLCLVSLPRLFLHEMPALEKLGVNFDRLRIAKETFTVLPWHRDIEEFEERTLGATKRDSTCRGIGPAYGDITRKYAISVADLLNEGALRTKVRENLAVKNLMANFGSLGHRESGVMKDLLEYGEMLRPYVVETDSYLCKVSENALYDSDLILLQQAQGAMLDVNSPSYPYVSSSGMTIHDACKIFRITPDDFEFRLGVCKAYTTSVGHRDFPTQLKDDIGHGLQRRGAEFGRTSGRPRDCGWLDGPALRHAILINKLTSLFVTKIDVLDQEPEILFCTHYETDNGTRSIAPRLGLGNCWPVYKKLNGWQKNTAGVRKLADLPSEARAYLDFIQEYAGIPYVGVSTGPDTFDTIWIGWDGN